MTLMSCDSVCCLFGKSLIDDAVDQWSSHLCAYVRTSGGQFEHTL